MSTSEKAQAVVREAIRNHAQQARKARTFAPARQYRDPAVVRQVGETMDGACARSDEFERTSLELMYAERGGDPAELPWNRR